MNRFQNADEAISIDLLKIDPAVEKKQREKLAKLRASRAASEVETSLAALRRGAEGDANLMPLIISCARAYCTEGEIIGVLREVFGGIQGDGYSVADISLLFYPL